MNQRLTLNLEFGSVGSVYLYQMHSEKKKKVRMGDVGLEQSHIDKKRLKSKYFAQVLLSPKLMPCTVYIMSNMEILSCKGTMFNFHTLCRCKKYNVLIKYITDVLRLHLNQDHIFALGLASPHTYVHDFQLNFCIMFN